MSDDSIDYQHLVDDALRGVVRRLLAEVAERGLPGEHYFYIGFRTGHPGVVMPRSLRDLYPEEMSLILQHQFWNLAVEGESFSVELSFSGSRRRLEVPLAALTLFADPSAEFALRFAPGLQGAAGMEARGVAGRPEPAAAGVPPGGGTAVPPGGGTAVPRPAPARPAAGPAAAPPAARGHEPGGVIRFDPSRRK